MIAVCLPGRFLTSWIWFRSTEEKHFNFDYWYYYWSFIVTCQLSIKVVKSGWKSESDIGPSSKSNLIPNLIRVDQNTMTCTSTRSSARVHADLQSPTGLISRRSQVKLPSSPRSRCSSIPHLQPGVGIAEQLIPGVGLAWEYRSRDSLSVQLFMKTSATSLPYITVTSRLSCYYSEREKSGRSLSPHATDWSHQLSICVSSCRRVSANRAEPQ